MTDYIADFKKRNPHVVIYKYAVVVTLRGKDVFKASHEGKVEADWSAIRAFLAEETTPENLFETRCWLLALWAVHTGTNMSGMKPSETISWDIEPIAADKRETE